MYTAQIVEKDTKQGVLKLTVEFTNGVDLFQEVFSFNNPTKDVIDYEIDQVIDRANKSEAFNVKEMSKHSVKETIDEDFQAKKNEEKAEREKQKEVVVDEAAPKEVKA